MFNQINNLNKNYLIYCGNRLFYPLVWVTLYTILIKCLFSRFWKWRKKAFFQENYIQNKIWFFLNSCLFTSPPRYNWNVVEICVKHHKPTLYLLQLTLTRNVFTLGGKLFTSQKTIPGHRFRMKTKKKL